MRPSSIVEAEEMNAAFQLTMPKDEFRRWSAAPERSEEKYEWVEGRVVQMANVTQAHMLVASNLIGFFRQHFVADDWLVGGADFRVDQPTFQRVPDVIVAPIADDHSVMSTTAPIIIAEVLSPSSVKTDLVDKLREYTSIASLEAYIVVSQEVAACWVWQRGADGSFPANAEEAIGRAAGIVLTGRGITLPLADVYRGTKAE